MTEPDLFTGATAELEQQHKRDALAAHGRRRHAWLDEIRTHLRRLFADRASQVRLGGSWWDPRSRAHHPRAFVVADDARYFFETLLRPTPPPASEVNRNFLGATFDAAWQEIPGLIYRSRLKGSHGNRQPCWEPR